MKRLARKIMVALHLAPPRPIESTRDELAHEIIERRAIHRRTTKLALILSDYRRGDGILRR